MPSAPSILSGVLRFLVRAAVTVVGAVLALAGLVLMLGVALFGVAVALLVVAWARLRGRQAPPVRFRWRHSWVRGGRFSRGFGARAPAGSAARRDREGEVVDVEFTERREPGAAPPKRLE